MVKRVVHTVVEDVEGESARDDTIGDSFGEDEMSEVGEGCFEGKEQGRGHDQTKSVHGKVVVDTVQEEMEHKSPRRIGEVIVDVEEEAMKSVLEDGPNDVAGEEARHRGGKGEL